MLEELRIDVENLAQGEWVAGEWRPLDDGGKEAVAVANAQELIKNSRPLSVHIFYFPWFGNPKSNEDGVYRWHTEVLKPSPPNCMSTCNPTLPDDIATAFYPQLGLYNSRNPDVIDQHMQWISSAGVNVVSISLVSPHKEDSAGHASDPLMPTLLDTAHKYKLKACVHLEPYASHTQESARAYIAYVINTYGAHAAFYRTASKTDSKIQLPLLYINTEYDDADLWQWRAIATSDGSLTIRGTKANALLIGYANSIIHVKNLKGNGFDGAYTYYAADGITNAKALPTEWGSLSAKCEKKNMFFIPSIMPGYDYIKSCPYHSNTSLDHEDGVYYKSQFETAHAAKADMVAINSFNGWISGTQIEPALTYTDGSNTFMYQKYNKGPEQYLQLTHEMVQTYFTKEDDDMNAAKGV